MKTHARHKVQRIKDRARYDRSDAYAIVDGLVLARSHFHHSANYRSVVAFGRARIVDDPAAKVAALAHFVEAMLPGRPAESRDPDRNELAATSVLHFDIV